jgi:hypothetical protein
MGLMAEISIDEVYGGELAFESPVLREPYSAGQMSQDIDFEVLIGSFTFTGYIERLTYRLGGLEETGIGDVFLAGLSGDTPVLRASYFMGTIAEIFISGTEPRPGDTMHLIDFVEDLKPVANFSGSPRWGLRHVSVKFTNLSVGNILRYLWAFGDGSNSNEKNPVHSYVPGIYSVLLKAWSYTQNDWVYKQNYIVVQDATIDFVGDNLSGPIPLRVRFTPTLSIV